MITVIAKLKAKPGKEKILKKELEALVVPTRAEAGCIDYFLHESPAQPGCFLFYENWKNQEALDNHFKTPHLATVLAKTGELLAEPLDLTQWSRTS